MTNRAELIAAAEDARLHLEWARTHLPEGEVEVASDRYGATLAALEGN